MYYQYPESGWKMLGEGISRVYQDKQDDRIPKYFLIHSLSVESNFVDFLRSILTAEQVWGIMKNYSLGATKDRKVIFWQIDYEKRIRSGKIMAYYDSKHPKFGHRMEGDKNNDWVHSRLIRMNILPRNYTLDQCLFGEHLLRRHPNKDVAFVEAEKTAVICSALFPEYIWVSCGGKNNFSLNRCKALRGRNVTFFPDTDIFGDTYNKWKGIANGELKFICNKIVVSDLLERIATFEQKRDKIDIADLLLLQLKKDCMTVYNTQQNKNDSRISEIIAKNPNVSILFKKLDLELIEE